MSTPDDKAAAFNPEAAPPPPVTTTADLTSAHFGSTIEVSGVTGELVVAYTDGVATKVAIQEDGRPFVTEFEVLPSTPCTMVDDVSLTDVVDMNDFYAKARELDRVSAQIRANDAATEELKKLKSKLSEELLGTFAQVGQSTLAFDNRRAYIHTELIPEFEEKDDGSRYGLKDLVEVFEALGREDQVTPKTVNYNTLRGVLREIRDGAIPMPPELAKMVKIGEKPEVRVGVGKRTTR